MKIEGKAAIVTGGGTGVGRSTALALAEQGCSVLINYSRSKDDAEKTAADVSALGVKGIAVRADVADDADCRSMVEAAVNEFGRLDVLVNNAGATVFVPHDDLEALKLDDWLRLYQVNVIGAFQCARAARAALTASGSGDIVNVTSIAGVAGTGSSIPYCASKAAMNNLTITLSRVFAPLVRVNAIAPGFIDTRWLRDGLGDDFENKLQERAGKMLLGKVLQPEDVAMSILGVITGSDLLTGQVIVLDSGMLNSNFAVR